MKDHEETWMFVMYEFKGLGGLQSINQKGLFGHEHEDYEVSKVTKCHSSKY